MQAISIQNVEPAAPPQGVVAGSKAQPAKGARSPFAALLAALRSGARSVGAEAAGGPAEAAEAKGAADPALAGDRAAEAAKGRGSKAIGRSEAKLTTDTIIARSQRGPASAAASGEVHADATPEGAALSGAADLASRARLKAGPRGAGTAEASEDAVAGETSAAKRRAGSARDRPELSAAQPQPRGEAVFIVGQPRAANAGEAKEDDGSVRGEGRRREAKRSDPKYSVIDLRMAAPKEDAAGPDRAARAVAESGRVEDAGLFAERGTSREAATPGEAKAAAEPQGGASFKEALAQRLEAGTGELVRAAQLVLKDGDLGLIRLRLEPESLGGVKIELKLAEKQISGRIVVESDLAAEAFRSSLDSLRDAFAEAGFDARAIDVEVRGDAGGQAGQGRERDGGDGERGPYWSARLRELDAAVPPAWAATESALNLVI